MTLYESKAALDVAWKDLLFELAYTLRLIQMIDKSKYMTLKTEYKNRLSLRII